MRRFLLIILTSLLVLPIVLPWIPHDFKHAIHDQHITHSDRNLRSGAAHSHTPEHLQDKFAENLDPKPHHDIELNAVVYYNEYLLVEFANQKQAASIAPIQEKQGTSFYLTDFTTPQQRLKRVSLRTRNLPLWQIFRRDHIPVFLSTQRVRI